MGTQARADARACAAVPARAACASAAARVAAQARLGAAARARRRLRRGAADRRDRRRRLSRCSASTSPRSRCAARARATPASTLRSRRGRRRVAARRRELRRRLGGGDDRARRRHGALAVGAAPRAALRRQPAPEHARARTADDARASRSRARRFDAHFDPRADHLRFYTRRTLARLLEDFGFEQIEVREAGGAPRRSPRTLLAASPCARASS